MPCFVPMSCFVLSSCFPENCENCVPNENVKVEKNDCFISGGSKYNQPTSPSKKGTDERNKPTREKTKQIQKNNEKTKHDYTSTQT